jgi:hypothetical protein
MIFTCRSILVITPCRMNILFQHLEDHAVSVRRVTELCFGGC